MTPRATDLQLVLVILHTGFSNIILLPKSLREVPLYIIEQQPCAHIWGIFATNKGWYQLVSTHTPNVLITGLCLIVSYKCPVSFLFCVCARGIVITCVKDWGLLLLGRSTYAEITSKLLLSPKFKNVSHSEWSSLVQHRFN